MRLAIFAFDLPYPPNSGGRLDIWAHATALAAEGHSVRLYCFAEGPAHPSFSHAVGAAGIEAAELLPFVESRIAQASLVERMCLLARKFLSPVPSCCSRTRLSTTDAARVSVRPSVRRRDAARPVGRT